MIVLVITIVVMLILAGVAISTLSGENGILVKSSEAVAKNDIEQTKEEIRTSISVIMIDNYGKYTTKDILNVAKKITGNDVELKNQTVLSKKGNKVDLSDLFIFASDDTEYITDTGNVINPTEINDALFSNLEGDTIMLKSNGIYNISGGNIKVCGGMTMDGRGATITGDIKNSQTNNIFNLTNNSAKDNEPIYTFKNLKFDTIMNSETGQCSALYTGRLNKGKVIFENCSFIDVQWDAVMIHIDPNNHNADIEVIFNNCYFDATGKITYKKHNGEEREGVYRYIHIEDAYKEANIKATIQNCTFNNIWRCGDDGITITGANYEEFYIGKNKTDDVDDFTNELWIRKDNNDYWSGGKPVEKIVEAFLGNKLVKLSDVINNIE